MRARGESCANTRAATGSDNFLEVMTTRHEAGCVTEPLKKVLGAQVRDLRLVRHLSQEGLAEELGVSTRYLAGIERGERQPSRWIRSTPSPSNSASRRTH